MTGTYPQAVTISPDRDDRETRVCQFSSRRDRQDPAVESVEAVCVDVVRGLGRAAYSGEYRDTVRLQLHFQQSHLDRVDDPKVSAAGTPVIVDLCPVALELKHGSAKPPAYHP